MGQLPESTAAENYFFILQRKILSATDVFHFSCWYIKCVLFSPQSDGYCCNGCNGFSQPWSSRCRYKSWPPTSVPVRVRAAREPEKEFQPARVHPTPASHQPSPISQHTFSLPLLLSFSLSISPLSNQFPSSSSVPPCSVFKYSRHFPLATNFSSSPLFVGPCNPSGLHWTPCYTFP